MTNIRVPVRLYRNANFQTRDIGKPFFRLRLKELQEQTLSQHRFHELALFRPLPAIRQSQRPRGIHGCASQFAPKIS